MTASDLPLLYFILLLAMLVLSGIGIAAIIAVCMDLGAKAEDEERDRALNRIKDKP